VNLTGSERLLLLGAFMDDLRMRLATLEGAVDPFTAPDEAVCTEAARTIDDAAHSIRGAATTIGCIGSPRLPSPSKANRRCRGAPVDGGGDLRAAGPLRATADGQLAASGGEGAGGGRTHVGTTSRRLVQLVLDKRLHWRWWRPARAEWDSSSPGTSLPTSCFSICGADISGHGTATIR
jgi:hypothetical protein